MTDAITVDIHKARELEKQLKDFKFKAWPFAVRGMLNGAAFKAREIAQKRISTDMVTRNKFTTQSVRVDRATGVMVRNMQSKVGSVAEYMETQEFGGVKTNKGGKSSPLPTGVASGEGENARPRRRLPRPQMKLENIVLNKGRRNTKARGRKQALLIKVIEAVETKKRLIYHESKRGRKGIYMVKGGRSRGKWKGRGWPTGARMFMVHDMSSNARVIPKSPWLKPSVEATQRGMPRMYVRELQRQIDRHRLFQDR